MLVQPISPEGEDIGSTFLAVDAVQAGPGDQVLVSREGGSVRQVLGVGEEPFHAAILAVIDAIEITPS